MIGKKLEYFKTNNQPSTHQLLGNESVTWYSKMMQLMTHFTADVVTIVFTPLQVYGCVMHNLVHWQNMQIQHGLE